MSSRSFSLLTGLLSVSLLSGCAAQSSTAAGAADASRNGTSSSGTTSSSSGTLGYAPLLPGGPADGGADAGDKYTAVGTNPFVVTTHDPLSTFAADVDTASYDVFRRDVNAGGLPAAASVRLEEYVNYFKYDYPAPTAGDAHPFRMSLAAAKDPFGRGTWLMRVGIQATQPGAFQKRPANLVFLTDVSGSMDEPSKLDLVKVVMKGALDVLDATDTVSIVTYSDTSTVRLAPTPVSSRATIEEVIDGLVAGGSTNGADGLTLAYQQARSAFINGGINHVILSTDGDFNVGPSSTSELLSIIRGQRVTGVTLTVLGFGSGNLNDSMMETVADAGNGMYAMISNSDQAVSYAHERLLHTIEHVAKDVKIQVELNPAHVYAWRLLGYEDRQLSDTQFRQDWVDAGEIGAGHRCTALYELVPAGLTWSPGPDQPPFDDGVTAPVMQQVAASDLALVRVRYKTIDATDTTPALEVSTSLAAAAVLDSIGATDADTQWAAAVAAWAEILKESPFADRSLLPWIQTVVDAQATRDTDRSELGALFAKAKPRLPVQ